VLAGTFHGLCPLARSEAQLTSELNRFRQVGTTPLMVDRLTARHLSTQDRITHTNTQNADINPCLERAEYERTLLKHYISNTVFL